MNIKKSLQAPLRRRQTARYEARIGEQTVRYHDWIVKKEEKERRIRQAEREKAETGQAEGFGDSLTVTRIPYSACGADFPRAEGYDADILVFHGDAGEPEEEGLTLIREFFAAHPGMVLAYADEDERLPENGGRRTNPWLKPDWSVDTLISYFYFGNLFAVRKSAAQGIEWLGSGDWRKNLYDFCLKLTDGACKSNACGISWSRDAGQALSGAGGLDGQGGFPAVGHLDCILFHGSAPIEPFGMEEEYDELRRQTYIRRGWPLKAEGKVSIIILSKDNPRVLSTCVHSVIEGSTYRNFEIIVVDNGSSEKNQARIRFMLSQMAPESRFRYVYAPQEFNFSRQCNQGAKLADGDYILLLNDDVEIIQEDWLEKMVEKASLPHVGAVGVKLLYPGSHTIQHAGITNIRLGPAHKLQFRDDRQDYYFLRNRLPFDMLGVTGACLMVKRSLYEASGGLAEDLRVAFNDVEYCYRLHDMGYWNVERNDVALYHHESLSRGLDDSVEKLKRLHQELNLLYERHPFIYGKDPYYHRYLVKDVLDQEFYAGNRYEYEDRVDTVVPEALAEGLRPEWENQVLRMGIEFAGDMKKWETGKSGDGDIFIQGWCYALQVDNSQYRFDLLLKPVNRGDGPQDEEPGAVWRLPVNRQYRPDIQENLGHLESQRVALTGVCLRFDRHALPAGEYRIGFLWEDCCSRQKLYQWTAETISMGDQIEK